MKDGRAGSVINDENSYASGQKKRPRGPRSRPTTEIVGTLIPRPHRPFVDLRTQAITYYLNCHLQPVEDAQNVSKSTSDHFISIWMSHGQQPILDLAVSAMALAVFSRTQRHQQAAIEASMSYHQLLQIARRTFVSLDEQNLETCLLAIFFMSRYEDTVHDPNHQSLSLPFTLTMHSFSHHDGALAMLKIWKTKLVDRQPATDPIKFTRRGLIRSALMRSLAVPKWMSEGTCFGECGLALEYDRIMVRLTNLRHRLITLLQEETVFPLASFELSSTVEELHEEAQKLDKALQHWSTQFPSTWSYQTHDLPEPYSWPLRDFYSPTVYSYSSPVDAGVWNQYFATRMLINSTRLKILEFRRLPSDDFALEQRHNCLSNMNTAATDLASSLPFCFEKFKVLDNSSSSCRPQPISLTVKEDIKPYMALLIAWPLSLASSIENLDLRQRSWFRSELARLGKIVGAGVFECAEIDQWLEF